MRIKNYSEDGTISLDDKLIGTDAQDSDNTKSYTIQDLQKVIRGYKVYTALLSQIGTNPPTAIVLENTIGDINFTYNGIGIYGVNSDGLFTENKTVNTLDQTANIYVGDDSLYYIYVINQDVNNITLITLDNGINSIDTVLEKKLIEIRVYN